MRRRVRSAVVTALGSAIAVILSCTFAPNADAALTDATVGPPSGEVGTTVTVSGSACPPGLLINPSRAGILVVTLGVSIDVPVAANGTWSVHFSVPANALPGAHAIVATCTRDLVPLPYIPLTFTVIAPEPPAPSTTIEGTAPTTTIVATTTTTAPPSAAGPSTTTAMVGGLGPGDDPPAGERPPSTKGLETVEPNISTHGVPVTTNATAVTTTRGTSVAGAAHAVVAARVDRDDRRSLVFGALSPVGHGWMGLLVSVLIIAAFLSALLALLWFRWLRHTRAREWWISWYNQILRIKAHARPPA